MNPVSPPLCVDLDGTLLKTDLLLESTLVLFKRNPLYLFCFPVWLLRGKANLKQQIADRVDLDVSVLPYRAELLTFLREEKARGRKLVLATASHAKYAARISDELGLFDEIHATSAGCNLNGIRKQRVLTDAFGERGFDYAANESVDLAIWAHARRAVLVDVSASLATRVSKLCEVEKSFPRQGSALKALVRAIRPHQWFKNALIFVPMLAAHRFAEPALLTKATLAFLAFSLCASSVYLLNDLLDLNADRHHSRKRLRPFAAGDLSIIAGGFWSMFLVAAGFALALSISGLFTIVLLGYYVLTLLYSFKLKEIVMLDVVALAALYTMRIIGGSAAVLIPPSFWLLAFSMFLFLSLAMVKRYTELQTLLQDGASKSRGRGYLVDDQALVHSLGASSGYMSVLVLALFINSEEGSALYHHPQVIWLLCPLLLYWISRVWFKAFRDEMHEDPVIFALSDPVSLALGGLGALIVLAAI